MGLVKDVGILLIFVVLIILGLGAAGVTATKLLIYWHHFWTGYTFHWPSLPFGL